MSEAPDPSTTPGSLYGNRASGMLGAALGIGGTAGGSAVQWQPPSCEELQALLSGYEVAEFIARGGMGAVYRGEQTSLGRQVAIKILPPALSNADPHYAERFKLEARAMAQLNHPGIVAVYDFGETAEGMLYFVMEYVDGTDVAQMVAREGRLHSQQAMAITAHVCDALQYAHDLGVIHRDIKPANIMVRQDGRVKVADFGLAKFTGPRDSALTLSGHVLGTMHFVAPEALTLGTGIDHRADIYAVGVMLYQMLTGRVPQGIFEMPSLQIPGLDPRYDAIIASAMRESREQRYQSVHDMRLALDGILTQPLAPTIPIHSSDDARPAAHDRTLVGQPPRKGLRVAAWVGVLIFVAVSAVAVWLWKSPLESSVAANNATPVTTPAGGQGGAPSPPEPQAKAQDSSPANATPQMFTNSLGMRFVPVPDTKVLMCIHETRKYDYEVFAKDNPGASLAWQNVSWEGQPVSTGPDHPVVKVNWHDAHDFCDWLSKKEGRRYRLPTDQEWSVAVGIKEDHSLFPGVLSERITTEFPWGQAWPPPGAVGNYMDSVWLKQDPGATTDGFPTTSPVMRFAPNRLGLYDLGGNVWEWVEDLWDNRRDGRVLRGSSWFDFSARYLYSSRRLFIDPEYRGDHYGFRCVLESALPTDAKAGTETSTSFNSKIPADAVPFQGKRYRFYRETITWEDAVRKCESLGGRLAVPSDAATWEVVRTFASEGTFWIGGTDREAEGQWRWIDGTPFSFTAWRPDQPDNWGGGENYLCADYRGWIDVLNEGRAGVSDYVIGFLCEWRELPEAASIQPSASAVR